MEPISDKEIINKILLSNPWWNEKASIDDDFRSMKPRAYLNSFYNLMTKLSVNRAVVLMGPRRVGKTVMIFHAIQKLIESGVDARKICYVSIDAPIYIGLRLEKILEYYLQVPGKNDLKNCYIFFDEIQYLKNWEVHLKTLVDDYRDLKFIASGSAAAALRLKSTESGAGRFTDFYLPPLTFYEYLYFLNREHLIIKSDSNDSNNPNTLFNYNSSDINSLNLEFINYMNFGGYPEAIFSEAIKADPQRYIRSDIIDKVLLRDLPGLYGIQDIQELNRLFTMLAYNTGNEVSLDELSKGAGVAKNTIKKYLEYLEAAFLITILHRVDQSGRRFKRANYFKTYLTNPSMRCALFEPIDMENRFMGNITETAIISQWLHSSVMKKLFYSRWHGGEVDLVYLAENKPSWCLEIKWSNRFFDNPKQLGSLIKFSRKHRFEKPSGVTTIDRRGLKEIEGISLQFIEASIYCYVIGLNTTKEKTIK